MRDNIREAFESINTLSPDNPLRSKQAKERERRFAMHMRIKEAEMLLTALLERGLEDMTLQELYNEIVGAASDT